MAILSIYLLELTQSHANIHTVYTATLSPAIVKGGGNISIFLLIFLHPQAIY
jgi:hypothetical protein